VKALQPYYSVLFLITVLCMACTDPGYEIAEPEYFVKTLPANYNGGPSDVIIPKEGGGFVVGNGSNLIAIDDFGHDMGFVGYSRSIRTIRNDWYGTSVIHETGTLFIDKLDSRFQPEKAFSVQSGFDEFVFLRHLDVSPDGQRMAVTVLVDDLHWILLIEEGVLVWQYQLPQKIQGVALSYAAAFLSGGDEIQVLAAGEEENGAGLYLFDLSPETAAPGLLRLLNAHLTGFNRVSRIGDRFLVEGWFEEQGEFRPFNDWYKAVALLDAGFNEYRHWHFESFQFLNAILSYRTGHIFLLTDRVKNDRNQTIEQFDLDGQSVNQWQIREESFIHSVALDENDDYLILGQLDRTDEYGKNHAFYFIHSQTDDPFKAFY